MSKFLMPASCMVGTSGRLEARLPLDTANARNFPARICGTDVITVSNMKSELAAEQVGERRRAALRARA